MPMLPSPAARRLASVPPQCRTDRCHHAVDPAARRPGRRGRRPGDVAPAICPPNLVAPLACGVRLALRIADTRTLPGVGIDARIVTASMTAVRSGLRRCGVSPERPAIAA